MTVEVQAVSKDLQTNFVTASQQGSGPDVVVGAHDWIGNLVQNGAIDPVQLTAEQKARLQRDRGQGGHLQRPALRRAVRHREPGADPQHRAGPRGAEDHRGPGRHRQEAQGRRRRPARSSACRSARTATPTTSTRSTPRPAATSSAPRPTATTTRRTWAWASRSRSRRSRRSRKLGEKGEGALKRSITDEQLDRHLHRQEVRLPGLRPVGDRRRQEGRHLVRHLPGPRLRRRQGGPAVRRRAGVLRRRQGQEQGAGPGVRHQLRDHPRAGRRALQGRAPAAGADRRLRPGQGRRPGPGQVPRGRQERPGAARRSRRWPRSGTRSARRRPPSSAAPTRPRRITAAGKTIPGQIK